jgi:hypothetical protein
MVSCGSLAVAEHVLLQALTLLTNLRRLATNVGWDKTGLLLPEIAKLTTLQCLRLRSSEHWAPATRLSTLRWDALSWANSLAAGLHGRGHSCGTVIEDYTYWANTSRTAAVAIGMCKQLAP